jgi:hypothetical protein
VIWVVAWALAVMLLLAFFHEATRKSDWEQQVDDEAQLAYLERWRRERARQ